MFPVGRSQARLYLEFQEWRCASLPAFSASAASFACHAPGCALFWGRFRNPEHFCGRVTGSLDWFGCTLLPSIACASNRHIGESTSIWLDITSLLLVWRSGHLPEMRKTCILRSQRAALSGSNLVEQQNFSRSLSLKESHHFTDVVSGFTSALGILQSYFLYCATPQNQWIAPVSTASCQYSWCVSQVRIESSCHGYGS